MVSKNENGVTQYALYDTKGNNISGFGSNELQIGNKWFYRESIEGSGTIKLHDTSSGNLMSDTEYKTAGSHEAYIEASNDDGTYTLAVGDDVCFKDEKLDKTPGYDNFNYIKDSKAYVYKKSSFSLDVSDDDYPTWLGNGLVSMNDGDDRSLYDAVSGKKLLSKYDDIQEAYGHIYAKKDGKTEIYEITSMFE